MRPTSFFIFFLAFLWEKNPAPLSTQQGWFLVRESESEPGNYSLSVRDGDAVKHYRIRTMDDGGFYITRRITFTNLHELIAHYKTSSDGLCCLLTLPCKNTSAPETSGLSHDTKDQVGGSGRARGRTVGNEL